MTREPDRERGRFDHLAVARPLTAGGVTGLRATATYDRVSHAGARDSLVALGAATGIRAEFDADPDALMRLEEAGLVEVFPQSRTIVSLIDVPLARQAQFLRRSIEQEAVRILADTADAGLVDRLHAVIEEQGKWAKAGDLERFNDADLAFHKILYDAAGVPDLWALVRKRSGHIDRIRRLHLPIGGKAAQIVRDHEAIVNAISKGEPDLAQSELRDHLSRSLAFSDELRVRFPGYFKE
jgi:DNA-binding GntR family transcriptional regulator